MEFSLKHVDKAGKARAGVLQTEHAAIETPVFMPVGTVGSVKGISASDLVKLGARIILGNTYHLYLRPGTALLEEAGGLHRFINWQGALLTDSGGYQVYSLSARRKINEEGVAFQSHIDGSRHFFTPEGVVDIQRSIGADIIMAFDECTPYPCTKEYAGRSLEVTMKWLDRCKQRMDQGEAKYQDAQTLMPIIQGSTYEDLRLRALEHVLKQDAEAYAIGGLSVGEPHEDMYRITELLCNGLPCDKPRYLMGVGTPENILRCIANGVDMFDCVMPTRNARNGQLFTSQGIINIRNKKWHNDFSAIDPAGTIEEDHSVSKAYLRHLFIAGEMLGPRIATMHNLAFYLWLVQTARKQILLDNFAGWMDAILPQITQKL